MYADVNCKICVHRRHLRKILGFLSWNVRVIPFAENTRTTIAVLFAADRRRDQLPYEVTITLPAWVKAILISKPLAQA